MAAGISSHPHHCPGRPPGFPSAWLGYTMKGVPGGAQGKGHLLLTNLEGGVIQALTGRAPPWPLLSPLKAPGLRQPLSFLLDMGTRTKAPFH